MTTPQQRGCATLQKQMAAGKLGMYIAAPDDIYNVIVPQDGGNIQDYGMGPLPSTAGTPAGTPQCSPRPTPPRRSGPGSSGWCSRTCRPAWASTTTPARRPTASPWAS